MADVVVHAENLHKRYLVGQDFQSYDTLRAALRRLVSLTDEKAYSREEIWAVSGVSFEIAQGEVFGIVGSNGSGKSTLLKLVSRITRPTIGVVRSRGRIGSVLEVGTGFHPELTGRENVMMNAAILGMSRRSLRARFDEIVEFAGVGAFIDTPLKRYSSGMRLRLAFAVVAHVEPEILAIDEVLAVGDAEFQRKCLGKMSDLRKEGRTVLFVSHDHGAVTRLCTRAIWLNHGKIEAEGPAADVVASYLSSVGSGEGTVTLGTESTDSAAVRSVSVVDRHGRPAGTVTRGEQIRLRLEIEVSRRIPGLDVAFYLVNGRGVTVVSEGWLDQRNDPLPPGRYAVEASFAGILNSDQYVLSVWIGDATEAFQHQEALSFDVLPQPQDVADDYRIRAVRPDPTWRLLDPW